MPGTQYEGGGVYLSIVGGRLRQKVAEGTEKAVLRKYETPTGEKGEKWELVYNTWEGVVRGLKVIENDYGKFLNVVFDDATLSIHSDSRYFSDFVKKLAGADLSKAIKVQPYDFEDENKKKVTGVNVFQGADKLKDYFYDFEKKKQLNGFPVSGHTKAKPYDKDDWKMYFMEVKKFLLAYVMLNIEPKLDRVEAEEIKMPEMEESEIQIDKVPF
jgi:hypothetical protein